MVATGGSHLGGARNALRSGQAYTHVYRHGEVWNTAPWGVVTERATYGVAWYDERIKPVFFQVTEPHLMLLPLTPPHEDGLDYHAVTGEASQQKTQRPARVTPQPRQSTVRPTRRATAQASQGTVRPTTRVGALSSSSPYNGSWYQARR